MIWQVMKVRPRYQVILYATAQVDITFQVVAEEKLQMIGAIEFLHLEWGVTVDQFENRWLHIFLVSGRCAFS